jgi:mono/diheme cytochrome c family protein
MRSLISLVLLLAGVGAAGAARAADPPKAEELGRQLYVRHCAACHGLDAKGDGPVAPELKTAPLDLTKIAARRDGEFSVGQLAEFIDGRRWVRIHGTREMPVWGDRFDEGPKDTTRGETATLGKVLVLIEYLRTIQDPQPNPAKTRK